MSSNGPALGVGQASVICVECGRIPLDALTLEFIPVKRALHFECRSPTIIYVGPKTSIVIHGHECGHAILIPYRTGTEMPGTPGCRALHMAQKKRRK